jgi:hypothetical protein
VVKVAMKDDRLAHRVAQLAVDLGRAATQRSPPLARGREAVLGGRGAPQPAHETRRGARRRLVGVGEERAELRPRQDSLEQHGALGAVDLEHAHAAAAGEPDQRVELLLELAVSRRAQLEHRGAAVGSADVRQLPHRGEHVPDRGSS